MAKFTVSGIYVTSADSNWVGEATSNQPLYSVGYTTFRNDPYYTSPIANIPTGGRWGTMYGFRDPGSSSEFRGALSICMGHCSGGLTATNGIAGEKLILWRLE